MNSSQLLSAYLALVCVSVKGLLKVINDLLLIAIIMKIHLKGAVTKIASVAVGVAMLITLASPVAAQTTQSTIDALLGQIAALQAQLLAMQGSGSGSMSCNFTTDLSTGMSNSQVLDLQRYLNAHGAVLASSGAGSPGSETNYFGSITKAAVIRWQNTNAAAVLTPVGLNSGTGYFGPSSRAFANSMCTTGPITGPGPITSTGLATVSAGAQPAASLAPQSAARVPFTKFTVSAGASPITVNSATIERTGLANDAVFSGIVLLDESGIQLGIAKTLNSNHTTIVGEPVVINAGSSRTFTVAGNMNASLSAYAGQVASLSVVSVNTSGTVVGSFPITGAAHTINASLSLGSATLLVSSFDPASAITKNVGDTGVKFAGVRVTAGSAEDMRLWSIRWNQSGSAGASDFNNLMTYVDGVAYPVVISSDGKYFTTTFGSGILVAKGLTKDVYIQGDIVGASSANRTIQFDMYKNTDLYLTGELFNYGIVASANGSCATSATDASEFIYSSASCAGTASTPFFSGSVVTVNAGTATSITKANEVSSQNIAVNVPNQILGGYSTDFKGESVSVQSSIFNIATSSGLVGEITSVSIYDETGKLVAGPVDSVYVSAALSKVTFTDTITYPVGRHVYTIKGKIPTGTTNASTVIVSATPSSGWTNVTGQITGNSISLSANGAFSMNTMTVRAASLNVGVSTNPTAQNVVAGAQAFLFANYQLDATQSGEDIRITNLLASITYGGTSNSTDLSSCAIYDGATQLTGGSNVYNPTGATTSVVTRTYTLDNSLTIAKGAVKTLALKCNVKGSATTGGTYAWGAVSGATGIGGISATGVQSSGTVTPTGPTAVGSIMTVASTGSLLASTDAASPGYTIASAGQSGVLMGVYKIRATNEDIDLTREGLKLTNTASSSASDLISVSLYDGATLVGTAVFTGTTNSATSTLSTPLRITRDADKLITVKVDFAAIGASSPATEGHLIAIDIDTAGAASVGNTQGTGVQSGSTVDATGSTAVAGVRLFKTYPTLALDTLPGSGVSDGRLMRFKVSADPAGNLSISKFTISLSTTSATVTSVNVFGFTDSGYSQPISGVNTGGQFLTTSACTGGCGSAPTLAIYPQTTGAATTTVSVSAGSTRWFEVRGTVTGTATTYSVTATLKGDSSYPAVGACITSSLTPCMLTASGVDATTGGAGQFIWSPNATTSVTVNGNDWTNGFGVNGLPQNGLIQTRSN